MNFVFPLFVYEFKNKEYPVKLQEPTSKIYFYLFIRSNLKLSEKIKRAYRERGKAHLRPLFRHRVVDRNYRDAVIHGRYTSWVAWRFSLSRSLSRLWIKHALTKPPFHRSSLYSHDIPERVRRLSWRAGFYARVAQPGAICTRRRFLPVGHCRGSRDNWETAVDLPCTSRARLIKLISPPVI